jgi:putative ABC transport system permease protein
MAWRDGRSSRRHLLLFLASMIVGIAAMVAIESFRSSLRDAVDQQALTLLGADLQVSANEPFGDSLKAVIDSVGGEQSLEIRFTSMVLFPESGGTRLVQVRALEGEFPYYGRLETVPVEAGNGFPKNRAALVDARLMLQFEMNPGDSVKVGDRSYVIGGALEGIPGESTMSALFGPRVYVPLDNLDPSLLEAGSRVRHYVRFKFEDASVLAGVSERFETLARDRTVRVTTVEDASDNWGDALNNLYGFLSLLGFMALLLGGVGVASAVNAYVREKTASVATLRCLGARTRDAFMIFLIQAAGIGLIAAAMGASIGLLVQLALPSVLEDFLPVDVEVHADWMAVLLGAGIGFVASIVFALLPMLLLRRVSALEALRASYERPESWWRDPLRVAVILAIMGSVTLYAMWTTSSVERGLLFAIGVLGVFLCLGAVAKFIIWASRRFFPARWPYVWRQGLANLYRPNNHTTVLVVAMGLGTTLILTVYLLQYTLLGAVSDLDARGGTNTILFDIQEDQIEMVEQAVVQLGLPIEEKTPIVTMRILEAGVQKVSDVRSDTAFVGEKWPFLREYRSSYRETLTSSETIVDGKWHGDEPITTSADAVVSLEEDIARQLGVGVGDNLVLDVQGVPMTAEVGSIRSVEWRRMSSNFFMVFDPGVLQSAPKFFVVATRVPDDAAAATLQRSIVADFPNVSIIDLDLILKTAGSILDRISFVIRFMALFCIVTGILVLIASVAASRYQRLRESILLRTLGASTKQIIAILNIENIFLGAMASLTGACLALVVSWLVARYMFEIPYIPAWYSIPVAFLVVTAFTTLFGSIGSRGAVRKPPLEVLRAES